VVLDAFGDIASLVLFPRLNPVVLFRGDLGRNEDTSVRQGYELIHLLLRARRGSVCRKPR
jgi:hypothetical protein